MLKINIFRSRVIGFIQGKRYVQDFFIQMIKFFLITHDRIHSGNTLDKIFSY